MTSLAWQQVAPGRYERNLDDVELLHENIASASTSLDKDKWALTVCVKYEVDPEMLEQFDVHAQVDALQNAWAALRYEHPTLASTIKDGKRFYQVADEEETARWVSETFTLELDLSSTDLLPNFPPLRGESSRMYFLPNSKEIVFRIPHDRCDGLGELYLVHNLFRILDGALTEAPQFGNEAVNLSPSLQIAANIPASTPEQTEQVSQLFGEVDAAQPRLALPATNADQVPGKTQRLESAFTAAETADIVKATESRGITAAHAVHAAIALAIKKLGQGEGKYVGLDMFSLRHICDDPYNSSKHPVAAYHTGSFSVVTPTDFENTAQEFRKSYAQASKTWNASERAIIQPFNKGLAPSRIPSKSADLSSLGVLDLVLPQHVGHFSINDIWFASDVSVPNIRCVLWTRSGIMKISASYNETYYNESFVKEYLDLVKQILIEGLGLTA